MACCYFYLNSLLLLCFIDERSDIKSCIASGQADLSSKSLLQSVIVNVIYLLSLIKVLVIKKISLFSQDLR